MSSGCSGRTSRRLGAAICIPDEDAGLVVDDDGKRSEIGSAMAVAQPSVALVREMLCEGNHRELTVSFRVGRSVMVACRFGRWYRCVWKLGTGW